TEGAYGDTRASDLQPCRCERWSKAQTFGRSDTACVPRGTASTVWSCTGYTAAGTSTASPSRAAWRSFRSQLCYASGWHDDDDVANRTHHAGCGRASDQHGEHTAAADWPAGYR